MNDKIYIKVIFFFVLINYSLCTINLTNYYFPKKEDYSEDETIVIPIIGTNDLHGGLFPIKYADINKNRYSYGGAINLYPYIKILREQWEDQILWLDGGDQIQGSMECMLTNCTIMTDFFNKAGLQGIALGNHDFDFGFDYLRDFIANQSAPLIVANVRYKDGPYLYEVWKNVYPYKIYTYGKNSLIKIGVIGLATKSTPEETGTDVSSLIFEDYLSITKNWTEYLRTKEKVNAVILLTHMGPSCNNVGRKIGMYNSTYNNTKLFASNELMYFLKDISKNKIQIDGLIAAHVHNIIHHWIYDIPVIQSSGSDYFHIMYLNFKIKKNKATLQRDKTLIEGPVPVCEKLWNKDIKNCEYKENKDSSKMDNFFFHNKIVLQDKELINDFKDIYKIINQKVENNICEAKNALKKNSANESALTNFITDVARKITDSDICFINVGGIRSSFRKGLINEIDLFQMFPFNNTLIRFEMYGFEVSELLKSLITSVVYPVSGVLRIVTKISQNSYKLVDALLWDGEEEKLLEPNKIYKVCTTDFLAYGGGVMNKVRKWYKELRNPEDFGNIRDIFYHYLKKMKYISEEQFLDKKHPRIIFE